MHEILWGAYPISMDDWMCKFVAGICVCTHSCVERDYFWSLSTGLTIHMLEPLLIAGNYGPLCFTNIKGHWRGTGVIHSDWDQAHVLFLKVWQLSIASKYHRMFHSSSMWCTVILVSFTYYYSISNFVVCFFVLPL